jgi:energy-coupling factor transport system permease protein
MEGYAGSEKRRLRDMSSVGGRALELYTFKNTVIHRLNPLTKLGWLVFCITLLSFFSDLRIIAVIVSILAIFMTLARLSRSRVAIISALLFVPGGSSPLYNLIAFFMFGPRKGEILLHITDWFWITDTDMVMGLTSSLRIYLIAAAGIFLLMVTSKPEFMWVLKRLRLGDKVALAVSIGLTFIPALASVYSSIREAQMSRALEIKGNPISRAKAYFALLTPLALGAMRYMSSLPLIIQARAWGYKESRTSIDQYNLKSVDYFLIAFFVITLVILFVYGYVFRELSMVI